MQAQELNQKKKKGMDVVGMPVGTEAHAVHCWKEAFEKKKVRPEVFSSSGRVTAQCGD